MGNAFVSVADDEEMIFYNPAGLAGVDGTTFNFVSTDLEISQDVVTSAQSSYSQFNNLSGDTLNVLMGKNIYMHADYVPTYITKNFGMAVIFDQQASLFTQNKALPQVQLGDQTTNGVQLGYGFSTNRGRNSKSDLRFGFGFKYLFRRGGYYDLTQTQIINMSQDEVHKIVGNYGTGMGFDLGTQYIYHLTNRITLQTGAAWTEVGGVKFSTDTAQPEPGDLSVGLSTRYHFAHISATLAYDYRHINQSVDYRLRNHFGAELSIPLFRIEAGINQVYPTFGFGVDLGLVTLMAVTYKEETSTLAEIDPERRYLLHISIGF